MCGICGKLDLQGKGIDRNLLLRMCRSFAYRGPDDEGVFVGPAIGLAHRRLSIIDLSTAGHQPIGNEDEKIWLVFNGEIYNFKTIREDLESRGHLFRSRTDCEIILHLYEEVGTDLFEYLNGMFAFALWDGNRKCLLLGRDRLGIKPLYYFLDGGKLVFGSEIKAILCDPDVPRDIDPEALDLYLTLSHIPDPWTIFSGIRKLEPGTFLRIERGVFSVQPYWDLHHREMEPPSQVESDARHFSRYKTRLRHLLEAAVKRRLIADVPLGAFLSGGIDSSIIVGLMARSSDRPVKTFSIGFKDLPSFDETAYAREVAALNHTEHHEFRLSYRDILEAFPKVLENVDEPFADSSAVPTYIVSRETKRHVTVALSGDGGDELFAGYRMYMGEYWARYYAKVPGFLRDGVMKPLSQLLPDARDKPGLEKIRRLKKFLMGMSADFPERFCGWREIFPFDLRRALLKDPHEEQVYLNLIRERIDREKDRFPDDPVNLMLYLDVKGLLPGDMLTKVDRMSMINSLEVRVPFLDHALAEFIFTLPAHTKLRARGGKYILLETFKDILPPSLLKRPKAGFEMPIGAWFRKELRFLIDEYLDRDRIQSQDIFHYGVIRSLIDDHMNRRRDTSWHLWNLIVFQHWYGTYF